MHTVKLRARYRTAPGNHVRLTVRFGDAQLGTSRVTLDEELVLVGDVEKLDLGDGSDLRGRHLSVVSTISDVNAESDRLLASYELSGGLEPLHLSLERHAADEAAERFVVDVSLM